MLDPEQIDQQLELLATHRCTLNHYLKQQAMLGEAHAPPDVTHGIEGARKHINRIKLALRSQDIQVEDHIDDTLITTPKSHMNTYNSSSNQPSIEAKSDIEQVDGALDFINRPWRSRWHIEEKPELFAYKSPNGFDGVCRIERIDLPNGQIVVICEQIDGNPGFSITNAVEYIALQVCEQYEIDPYKLIWIEHYDTWFSKQEDWKLVSFAKKPPEANFADPNWKRMTKKDWQTLGLRPREKRTEHKEEPSSLVEKYRRRK